MCLADELPKRRPSPEGSVDPKQNVGTAREQCEAQNSHAAFAWGFPTSETARKLIKINQTKFIQLALGAGIRKLYYARWGEKRRCGLKRIMLCVVELLDKILIKIIFK